MEFAFPIRRCLPQRLTIITGGQIQAVEGQGTSSSSYNGLHAIIDAMGAASAKAQGLGAIITSVEKLKQRDHKMYFLADHEANDGKGGCIGFLRVGVINNIWVIDNFGKHVKTKPMCVLDFYVHESCQRRGFGKELFEAMLADQRVVPGDLAYDRPSPKLLGFLALHYRLTSPRKQPNSFVIYQPFLATPGEGSSSSAASDKSRDCGYNNDLVSGIIADSMERPWSPVATAKYGGGSRRSLTPPWATSAIRQQQDMYKQPHSSVLTGAEGGQLAHLPMSSARTSNTGFGPCRAWSSPKTRHDRSRSVTPPTGGMPKPRGVTDGGTTSFSRHLSRPHNTGPRERSRVNKHDNSVPSDFVGRLKSDWGNKTKNRAL